MKKTKINMDLAKGRRVVDVRDSGKRREIFVNWSRGKPVPPFVEVGLDAAGGLVDPVIGYDYIREHYYLRIVDQSAVGLPAFIVYIGHCVNWMSRPAVLYFTVGKDHFERCEELAIAFNRLNDPIHHAGRVLVCRTDEKVPEDNQDHSAMEAILNKHINQWPKPTYE